VQDVLQMRFLRLTLLRFAVEVPVPGLLGSLEETILLSGDEDSPESDDNDDDTASIAAASDSGLDATRIISKVAS
jgi:hypothetical protein